MAWPLEVTVPFQAIDLAGALGASALALAAVATADRRRRARRSRSLNRALHELRRPLQVLALAAPGAGPPPGALDLALAATEELDREINGCGGRSRREPGGALGRAAPLAARPIAARSVVEQAVARWLGWAAAAHRSLELRWRAGATQIVADPRALARALDNLLDNALSHGGLRVRVSAAVAGAVLRITVADSGPGLASARRRRRPDPRRGHGLAIVREIAAAHGGRFAIATSPTGSTAILELPLAAGPRAAPRAPALRR